MSETRRAWETPMQYNEDRFDDKADLPAQPERGRPVRDAYDQPSADWDVKAEADSEPFRPLAEWDKPRYNTTDDEPLNYRNGDPNAVLGLEDSDEAGE